MPRAGAPGQHRGRAVGSGLGGCSLGSPGPPHPAAQSANGSCCGIPVPTAWFVAVPSPASPGPLCLQVLGSSCPRYPRVEQEPGEPKITGLGSGSNPQPLLPGSTSCGHRLTRDELVQVHLLAVVFVHVQHEEA